MAAERNRCRAWHFELIAALTIADCADHLDSTLDVVRHAENSTRKFDVTGASDDSAIVMVGCIATGGNVNHLIALYSTLNDYAAHGGPEFDSGKSAQFIDTDKRLGNTGACTLFMQMALGVMGSYRDGGVSAAINLRDDHEASIVFISPPSQARREEQKHPDGGDVFGHHVEPAIDPANYPPN